MSSKMKMGGFMCRSPASTAVCLPDDMRSVIVPRKSSATRSMVVIDHDDDRIVRRSSVKYSRLVEAEKRLAAPKANSRRERDDMLLPLAHHQRNLVDHRKQQEEKKKPRANLQLSSITPPSTQVFQVVVLRVSLHCQGCAGKVKRHLSRMEGVTSFSIDLETKRVTVMGHVSPTGVLESISKIKRAEFWPC